MIIGTTTSIGPDVISYINKQSNELIDNKKQLASHLRIYGRIEVANEIDAMTENEYEDFVCNTL